MNYETDKEQYIEEQNEEGTAETVPSEAEEETAVVQKRKKRKKKHYTLKFLGFIAFCVILYFFLHSSVFTVENIVLEKNSHMNLKQAQKVTGLEKGTNLFDVKPGKCEDKLLEDPYVKEANVKRKLPDTVEINLVLREPTAVIKYNKKYVLIDSEGTVLKITEKLPHFTLIEGITVKEAAEGETVQVKETEKYGKYMKLLAKIKASNLFFKRLEIDGKIVRAYVKDKFYCEGKMDNMIAGMEDGNLQAVIWDLMKRDTKKGVVTVGDDRYYSFSK